MHKDEQKQIDDISDAEIRSYSRLSSFSVGKPFFVVLIFGVAVGFLSYGFNGVAWAVIIIFICKLIIALSVIFLFEPIAKTFDSEGYKEYLQWEKRKYHKKYYGNSQND